MPFGIEMIKTGSPKQVVGDTLPNKKPTNWWGRQNSALLKFYPKPSKAPFLAVFSNFHKCRPEVGDE